MAAQHIHLSIPDPCSEDWNAMTMVTEMHRHCKACDRVLVDFTEMTDDEIVLYLRQHKKPCGRFRSDQLNRDYRIPAAVSQKKSGWKWLAALLVPFGAQAQHNSNPWLDVLVTDTANNPIDMASVSFNDFSGGASTNADGHARIYNGASAYPDSIIVSSIGYSSVRVAVNQNGYQKIILESKPVVCSTVVITASNDFAKGHIVGAIPAVTIVPQKIPVKQRLRKFWSRLIHPRNNKP